MDAMIVLDQKTIDAIDRYDSMRPDSPLKSVSAADLTPEVIARELDIDVVRSVIVLDLIQNHADDVLYSPENGS